MPSVIIAPQGAVLAAIGGATGVLQVASTANFFPGAEAYLSDNTGLSAHIMIVSITDATHMTARTIPDSGSNVNSLSYAGGSSFATFTVVNGARVDQPRQVCNVDQPTYSKLPSIP